jgi:hypothetical protein
MKIIRILIKGLPQGITPLPAISLINGEGENASEIVVLEKLYPVIHSTMLTLYCGGSGANQSVCLLKVIPSSAEDKILAIRVFPEEVSFNLSTYFHDTSRRERLFALPIYNTDELRLIKLEEG